MSTHTFPAQATMTGARWTPREVDEHLVTQLAAAYDLHPAIARCLALRAPDPTAIDARWLRPDLDALHDPLTMMGMPAALARLDRAIADGERLRVITDYDVDGTTSSLILQAALRMRRPDLQLDFHIPTRFDEGYGFSVRAAEKAVADGVNLIITADIGVRDHAAVAVARNGGVDVLICDHHLPAGEAVPADAFVLCPPQNGETYENRSLAACGVTLKLAQAMLATHPRRDDVVRSLLKLAAIGTVADLVPLTTLENRAIVTLGLHALNTDRHAPGLAALLKVSGVKPGQITEGDLGFYVGPRINAAGRIDDASLVVKLLTSRDATTADQLATSLNQLNSNRQHLQRDVQTQAIAAVGDAPASFVVVHGPESEGWHRGVVGIVASKLKERYNRPVAVVSVLGELATGSVRSVPGLHAVRALESVADLLVRFGGHPAAAGFTLPAASLPALQQRLAAWVDEQGARDFTPEHEVDATLDVSEVDEGLLRQLSMLRPFGMGNPRPKLRIVGVRPQWVSTVGKRDPKALKFTLGGAPGRVTGLWWGEGDRAPAFEDAQVTLLGAIEENIYNGRSSLQVVLTDAQTTDDGSV